MMKGRSNADGMIFNFVHCPQQDNGGNSCGPFACLFAYAAALNNVSFHDVDEQELRNAIHGITCLNDETHWRTLDKFVKVAEDDDSQLLVKPHSNLKTQQSKPQSMAEQPTTGGSGSKPTVSHRLRPF